MNFYRRFIYSYSKITASLTHLIKKNVTFAWFLKCQMAFNTLKETFISDVILHHYNPNHKIVIKTDVSDYVSEGILSQYNKNEVLHSVVYFLKKHNSAECNYKIYNKEFIIIIYVFEEWCLKLEGSTFPVKVITDHKNLEISCSSNNSAITKFAEVNSCLVSITASHTTLIKLKINQMLWFIDQAIFLGRGILQILTIYINIKWFSSLMF